jgi:uncharacterized protein (TIGR02453 family)
MKTIQFESFKGLKPEVNDFLVNLGQNNNKAWFDDNRHFYDDFIKPQLKALVNDMGAKFSSAGLPYIADPKKALFRINKDIRFSANKEPYKTNLGVFFPYTLSQTRDHATESLGLYFHFEPSGAFIAAGIHMPPNEQLRAIRQRIAEDYPILEKIISNPKLKAEFPQILVGESLKRAPQGFPQDHPALELLKLKEYTLFCPITLEETYSPALLDTLLRKAKVIEQFLIFFYEALA